MIEQVLSLEDRAVTVQLDDDSRVEMEGDDMFLQRSNGHRCPIFLLRTQGSTAEIMEVE